MYVLLKIIQTTGPYFRPGETLITAIHRERYSLVIDSRKRSMTPFIFQIEYSYTHTDKMTVLRFLLELPVGSRRSDFNVQFSPAGENLNPRTHGSMYLGTVIDRNATVRPVNNHMNMEHALHALCFTFYQ